MKNLSILFFLGVSFSCSIINANDHRNSIFFTPHGNDTIKTVDSTKVEKPTHFTVSATGGSNLVQKGKKTATQQHYITPKIGYSFKNGINLYLSANYLVDVKKKPLDNVAFGAGYSHSFGDHLSIDLGYSYTHYNSSKQVSSSEPNTFNVSASWSGKVITPSLSTSYGFGVGSDFTNDFTLAHSFDFKKICGKNDQLSIPLSIGASAGTSNFYKEYSKKNALKTKVGKTVTPDQINTKYALTSLTLGTGITYTIKHFSISPAINYYFSPNDPLNIDINTAPDITLGLSLSF